MEFIISNIPEKVLSYMDETPAGYNDHMYLLRYVDEQVTDVLVYWMGTNCGIYYCLGDRYHFKPEDTCERYNNKLKHALRDGYWGISWSGHTKENMEKFIADLKEKKDVPVKLREDDRHLPPYDPIIYTIKVVN